MLNKILKQVIGIIVLPVILNGQIRYEYTVKIPIVVHQILDNVSDSLTQKQIDDAIKTLNTDFLTLKNPNLNGTECQEFVSEVKINFYRATELSTDDFTKGIKIKQRLGRKRNFEKLSNLYYPKKYLNIYVGNLPISYCYNNPLASDSIDALYMDLSALISNKHILTHYVGHWLGLSDHPEAKVSKEREKINKCFRSPSEKPGSNAQITYDLQAGDKVIGKNLKTGCQNYMNIEGPGYYFEQSQFWKMVDNLINNRSEMW